MLSSANRRFLSIVQEPLAVTREPYGAYAEKLGVSQEAVLARLKEMKKKGIIRRVAGIVKHRKIGYGTNAMVVFMLPKKDIDRAGKTLALFDFITHCYRRPRRPGWPFSLYAMVHAKSRHDLEAKLGRIRKKVMFEKMEVLPSEKEFKKSPLRLFASKEVQ